MNAKTVLLSAFLVAALALGACTPTTTINNLPQPYVRTLNVTGVGYVNVTPDVAYITIGVHTEDASASAALGLNNEKSAAVMDALKRFGVKPEDIRTTNLSVYPMTTYDEKGQPVQQVYVVDNSVYVTVRDLNKLGELLDAAVQAGANAINSIQFDVLDKETALTQARQAAVESAIAQAQQLASAAGVELGPVQSIAYYDSTPVPYYDSYAGKGGGAYAAVPVAPGQLQITATVNITYELK